MSFSLPRALVLFLISLPVGFVLSALAITSMQFPIVPHIILPWAASLALFVGLVAGFRKRAG